MEEERNNYINEVKTAANNYGEDLIINLDETPAHQVEKPLKSWSIGNSQPTFESKGEEKRNVTLIACGTMSGRKLPLGFVNKGKFNLGVDYTSLGIQRMNISESDLKSNIFGYSSPKGWSNGTITTQFIRDSIIPYINSETPLNSIREFRCALLLDDFKPHWTDEVKSLCREQKIQLIKVPPKQTDDSQPLDISFMGPFHIHRETLWRDERYKTGNIEDSVGAAVIRALNAYKDLTQSTIKNGWNLFRNV